MANVIRIKRSNVQGKAPEPADLDFGELAINTYDGKLFLKKQEGLGTPTVISVGEFTSDFVKSLVAGTGVAVADNTGKAATPTISIGQDVSTTAGVTFGSVTLNTNGFIEFADTTTQLTRASRLYTNTDVAAGLDINTLMAGDYYFDDIGASIYLVISNSMEAGIVLQDLTVRA